MIKCDVGYCEHNRDGVCELESIRLNINRRCTDYLPPEAERLPEDFRPQSYTGTYLGCDD